MAGSPRIISAARLIAVCTLLSRVTGLVRDMLLAQLFSLGRVYDAWVFAFQVPNLFRRLIAEGVLAAIFVPTFTHTLEHDGRESAWRLLARTLALLVITLVGVLLVCELIVLAAWFFEFSDRELLLSLTALMLPFMVTICVVALFSSILNAVGSFVPAALTPIILNLFMIGGVLFVGPWLSPEVLANQVYGVALSVLAAGVVQIAFIYPVLRANGVSVRWEWKPRDAKVREMIRSMGPVTLGQGLLVLSTFFDAFIAIALTTPNGASAGDWRPLAHGALSSITVAQRLYQFPLGVLIISLAVAALPTFSRLAARTAWDDWRREVRATLRLAIFGGLLAGVMTLALADEIVGLLFEYRNFSAADTSRAASVLRIYGIGMWAFCAQHIVLRAFYSLGDVRTPLRVSLLFVPLNIVLTLAMVWWLRERAFAMSSIVSASGAVLAGIWLLQRKRAAVIDASTLGAIARMVVAAGAAIATVLLLRPVLADAAPDEFGRIAERGIETVGLLAIGSAVYVAVSLMLRLREPIELVRRAARGAA